MEGFWYETRTKIVYILVIFQRVHLCSATSMESSRRDLLNDMAEHRATLKNNENTYNPCFGFTSKTGIAFSKTGFCFYGSLKGCSLYFMRVIFSQLTPCLVL